MLCKMRKHLDLSRKLVIGLETPLHTHQWDWCFPVQPKLSLYNAHLHALKSSWSFHFVIAKYSSRLTTIINPTALSISTNAKPYPHAIQANGHDSESRMKAGAIKRMSGALGYYKVDQDNFVFSIAGAKIVQISKYLYSEKPPTATWGTMGMTTEPYCT